MKNPNLCKYRQKNPTTGTDCYLPFEPGRCDVENKYKNCIVYIKKEATRRDYNNEPLGIGGADLESYQNIVKYVSKEEQTKRLREMK